jgi:superoxide dismutase
MKSSAPRRPQQTSQARLSRRALLSAGATAAMAIASRAIPAAADTVNERGLAGAGLLAGVPGFQPRKPISLAYESYPGFLSHGQVASCYGDYRRAFDSLIAAESALASTSRAPADSATFERLRAEQVASANTVLLYELYFGNVAVGAPAPPRSVIRNMGKHMGTMAAWREDFAACARVASAWAALVYDPYDDRWHDVAMGAGGTGAWIGANPIVVCPVMHSAWQIDYRSLGDFIDAFFKHIDWRAVAARYRAVNRE